MFYEIYKNLFGSIQRFVITDLYGKSHIMQIWDFRLGDIFLIFLAHGYLLYFLCDGKKPQIKKVIKDFLPIKFNNKS